LAAAERYRGVVDPAVSALPFPATLRQPNAYADVWYLDLVEWELGGDYASICATLIANLRYPDPFRRRALMLMLEPTPAPDDSGGWARVAQKLGELQLYVGLAALERLYERGDAKVRAAVMRALGQMFFKRSFGLLGKGLADAQVHVRDAAIESLRKLHFP